MKNSKYSIQSSIVKSVNDITPTNGDVNLNMKFYSAPSQLGLTNGSATLTQIWNAMPNASVFISIASNILTSELPNSDSAYSICISKQNGARGFIIAYGKGQSNFDFRMHFNSSNMPTGTWVAIPDSSSVVSSTNGKMIYELGGTTNHLEIRGVGSVGSTSYRPALVIADSNNTAVSYYYFIGTDGSRNFVYPSEIGKQILSYERVSVSSSSAIANYATTTLTGTMTSVSGAKEYIIIPERINYGFFTGNPNRSGTSISIAGMNSSGANHTLSGTVMVIALK